MNPTKPKQTAPVGPEAFPPSPWARDRRKYPRISVERLVAYTSTDSQGRPRDMGMAKTCDLSQGGLGIILHKAVEVGDTFHVFMASGESLVEATVKVIHFKEQNQGLYRIGTCFTSMEETAHRTLYARNSTLQPPTGRRWPKEERP